MLLLGKTTSDRGWSYRKVNISKGKCFFACSGVANHMECMPPVATCVHGVCFCSVKEKVDWYFIAMNLMVYDFLYYGKYRFPIQSIIHK